MRRTSKGRWGIVGAGTISRRFAEELRYSGGQLIAVGSASRQRAKDFRAGLADSEVRVGLHDDVISAPDIDALYVATLHHQHSALVLAALENGKKVLCEKPLAPSMEEVGKITESARVHQLTVLEGYMYLFAPSTQTVLQRIAEGAVGELRHIDATFAFRTVDRSGWLYQPSAAGGAILNVGGYPITFASAAAGAALGGKSASPLSFRATGSIGPTGVDEWTVAQLEFPGGITASVRCGQSVGEQSSIAVYGSRGRMLMDDPWCVGRVQRVSTDLFGNSPEQQRFVSVRPYAREARALINSDREVDTFTLDDSLATAALLAHWRSELGLRPHMVSS